MIKSRFFAFIKFDFGYNSKQPWRQDPGLTIHPAAPEPHLYGPKAVLALLLLGPALTPH
jgi:hypothetical protein